ncbi:type I secretion C-terminal target domain-containing protein [Mesorhizobium sp. M1A.F.Ca.IN.022.06.1.1]|uniref:Ig-like domain-containing protein n=49 Tax=Mesorhizobium TaxID=68287 RepID=UPI000F761791|nr:Ig-like domain-containing protein [Mesorhizobium sp. M1A.F.Ca.IN.022.06.1.1]AZO61875.1 type I secretion C-terminal target domain-containing protein [Mesorhizobium sp. M1A.F.Ca.IN.022.06.1.1]
MTTSIEFDAVSNFSDEHATVSEQPISGVISGVQVAQASGGQTAPAAGEPVPVDVGSGAPAKGDGNAQNAQSTAKPAADGNAPAANAPAGNAPTPNTAASYVAHEYHAEAGNVVKLPANVSIDDIKVDGHNLVLVQPDGAEIVIKDGALNVPTFIIGDVEVPRVALIAALEASHVDVAFGADGSISAGGNGSPSSAGGDFSVPPGGIGDGFGLSALLPPTALAFGQPENRELFPSLLKPDSTPSIGTIGEASVNEAGLPPHGGLPAGSGEIADGDSGNNSNTSETTSGTIGFTSPDGVAQVTLGGHVLTSAAQTFTDATGSLTASYSFDAATGTGTINYSYTLNTNTSGDGTSVSFAVGVTDSDGDAAPPGTLVINIIDDAPTAVADTDAVPSGSHASIDGNVITGAGSDGNATGADIQGADGASVTSAYGKDGAGSAQTVTGAGVSIVGEYGTLVLHSDGSYTYTRAAETKGGVDDVFHYTLTDGDGNQSSTTLTISIGNSTPTVTDLTPAANGGDVTVNEDDLLASRGAGESAGSDTSKESTTQGGTFTIASPDGIATLSIDGHAFITNGVFSAGSFTTALGNTLNVTGYNAATGVVSYTYTLNDNETHAAGQGTNSLFENMTVSLTDQDGQNATGTLSVNIVDDVPTAVADTDAVPAGSFASIGGNVMTGAGSDGNAAGADTKGADGATVVGVAAGNTNADLDNAATVGSVIQGTYGKLTLNADGSYTYVRDAGTAGGHDDVFTYTIKDGDGDTSHTTLTISIGNTPPTITDLTPAANGGDVTVKEDDLLASRGAGESAGSDTSKESTTQGGTFTIASPDGIATLSIDGHAFITNGVFSAGSFTTALGNTLNVTGYNAATGVVSYTYTLNDNETHAAGQGTNSLFENMTVSLTDQDGQNATGTLSVNIVDDVPTAVADTDAVPAGSFASIGGNVMTGAGSDGNAAGADTKGADGATVVGVAAGNTNADLDSAATVGSVIQGTYGKLTLNADGSYTYVRDAGTAGGHDDVFTYTIKDGDGDTSHTTLTISIGNTPPTITDLTPAANGGDVTVNEDDLLASRGAGESAGSDTSKESTTQGGTFTIASPDGIATLSIDGHAFITNGVFSAGSFTTALGNTLNVTGYNAATGVVSYTYTLNDNETHAAGQGTNSLFENMTVSLTDQDGQNATGTLSVNIVDDVPTAVADTDAVPAGSFASIGGNVMTGAGSDGNAAGADTKGADGATVVGVAAGNTNADLDNAATVGSVIQGTYGKLTLNADGSYTYVRDAGTAGGHDDVFTYTIKDGDGDTSHTTLTISIGNTPPTITDLTPAANGGDVTVNEDDLLASRGAGESAGSDTSKESTTQGGTFTIASPDGIATLSIDGHAFITNGVFSAGSFTTALGNTLNVTGYNAATGVVSYTYTLNDNETHAAGQGTNSLFENMTVSLTDQDGQNATGTLSVNIVDDVPTAVADTDAVPAGSFASIGGNVMTGAGSDGNAAGADTKGADGATVVGVAAGNTNADLDSAATVGSVIQGTYGKLTLNADGSYTYVRDAGTAGGHDDVFTYTIKDGDGDTSHTTLTISIGNTPPTITDLTPAANGGDVTVNEDDLLASRGAGESAGSDTSKESTTQGGTFTIASPDGIATLSIDGHAFITNGVFSAGSFTTALGNTLNVTGYNAATGVVSYTYTLNDNETHAAGQGTNSLFENMTVSLTDQDGQNATGTLSVNIVDDVPTAVADTDAVPAGSFASIGGNVMTGAGSDGNAAGADTKGADGATVVGVAAGNTNADLDSAATVGSVIQGTYGKLTLNADGSYTYVRDAGTAGGHDDVFTYTIKDGDGDTSHTTLTISIGNTPPTITDLTPAANGGDVTVNEDDLLASRGAGESAGSDTSKESTTQGGTFTIASPDGIATLSIDGHAFITNGVFSAGSFTTALGNTLNVTGYNAATGVVSYTYTLNDNETHAAGQGTNSLFENMTVSLTDQDGQNATGTLSVNIVDDVPTAVADTDAVPAGSFASIGGNVMTGAGSDGNAAGADTKGADGATVVGVAAGNTNADLDSAATVGSVIQGTYGKLTLNADGSYTYVRDAGTAGGHDDVFTYTIKDGDGDTSHTTLTISIGNTPPTITDLTPAANGGDVTVNEDDLLASRGAGESAGSDTSKESTTQGGTFTIASPDGIATLSIDGHAFITNGVFSAGSFTTALGNTLNVTGYNAATGVVSYTYTLNDNETHAAGQGTNSLFENMTVSLTDQDGQNATGTLSANIIDDVPTLNSVQGQQASNDPAQTPAVGAINFVPGADGAGAAMTITVNTTGLTSNGHNLVTEQVGNVLTAYADNNNNGSHDAGDTAVFTVTVNTAAGTSGQYTFDLLAKLDGMTSNVSIASSGSFGAGPSNSIVVTAGGQNIVMVTGWAPTDAGGIFTGAHEAAWLAGGDPSLAQTSNVNGSTAGWGLGNNNFDAGEFMRFDFGAPNDYDGAGGYTPPAITMANVSYAKFSFDAVSASNKVEFVAHYTDGSTASFIPTTGATSLTINSPAGLQIAWVDAYESSGKTKLNLTDVGVTSTTVDHTIPVTLQLTDGDGDQTGTANFTVHVKDGLTPFAVATPVVLDLNHDGIQTTDLTHSTVSFDYNGDGVASKTAWVDSHDGILAIDLNGDGKVNNGSEIAFTQHAPGAATDLAALEQVYDTNHDGKLTAADHDFAQFGVWQDANGNGVSDPGEFKSLAALGIVEIGLESNNQHSVSADGSVLTYGEATFTTANGETGAVADIGFGNFDSAASGAASTMAGTSGADTFKLDSLDIKDLITDYHGSEGDKIDLSALFDTAPAGNINNYVHYNSETNTVSVDASGSGNPANFVDVAVLQNAPAAGTINILYDDSNHQQHTATI